VPSAPWFTCQPPAPSHLPASPPRRSSDLPHAVPSALKPLSWHAPVRHVSWFTHSVPASPHEVPSATWFTWQAPAPSHVSAASHEPLEASPHAVPAGLKPLSWHAPARHVSWFTHSVPASPHEVPSEAWFAWQLPAPSQVSAASHEPLDESPHAVPSALKPLSWHAPARHVSWFTHSVPASRHEVPSAAWFTWQAPAPSHVSAAS